MNSGRTSFDDLFKAAQKEVEANHGLKPRLAPKFSFSTASTSKPPVFRLTLAVAQSIVSSSIDLSALPNKRSCK
jgi:hypothetical protein